MEWNGERVNRHANKHKHLLGPMCVKSMLLFSDVVTEEIALKSRLRTPDREVEKSDKC